MYFLYVGDWSSTVGGSNAGAFSVSVSCPEPCTENEVVVEMSDAFGDGWNGNILDIVDENNNTVASATITGGSSGSESFCLPDGCYTVNVDGGSFDNEVGWDISVNGNVALSGGAPASGLELEINSSCAPPTPENTSCANAELATLGVNETETVNVGDGAENGCTFPISSGSADHARWFTFTPAQSGEYRIGSSGLTSADTRLSIYTGNCGSLTCFASNDDANGEADRASEVTTCLQAGVTYYIEWDDSWSIASFNWNISYNGIGECGPSGDLPAPWTANDIGNTGNGNDYGFDNGTFAVTSGGRNGSSNTNDNMAFASQAICGNGSITVRVEDVSGSGFGGVAMRESTASGSKHAMLLSNQSAILPWLTRTTVNGPNNFTTFYRPFAFWLRLERIGDYIRAYTSTTGNNFTIVAQTYLPMDNCVEIGMIVANTGGGQTTAQFSNVTVVGGTPLLAADETNEVAQSNLDKAAAPAEVRGFEQPAQVAAARLFPNPASSRITIDLPAAQPMEATLVLRNQLGQVLQSRQVEAGLFQTDWDVSQLSGGVYYMEVRYEGQQPQVLRFVKTQ